MNEIKFNPNIYDTIRKDIKKYIVKKVGCVYEFKGKAKRTCSKIEHVLRD